MRRIALLLQVTWGACAGCGEPPRHPPEARATDEKTNKHPGEPHAASVGTTPKDSKDATGPLVRAGTKEVGSSARRPRRIRVPVGQVMTFETRRPGLHQTLTVRGITPTKIQFTIAIEEPCRRTESGTTDEYRGSENDDDPEDDYHAYTVDEFVFKRDAACWIHVRIDAEEGRRARVEEPIACSPQCPADPRALMRRVKDP